MDRNHLVPQFSTVPPPPPLPSLFEVRAQPSASNFNGPAARFLPRTSRSTSVASISPPRLPVDHHQCQAWRARSRNERRIAPRRGVEEGGDANSPRASRRRGPPRGTRGPGVGPRSPSRPSAHPPSPFPASRARTLGRDPRRPPTDAPDATPRRGGAADRAGLRTGRTPRRSPTRSGDAGRPLILLPLCAARRMHGTIASQRRRRRVPFRGNAPPRSASSVVPLVRESPHPPPSFVR